MSMPEIMHRLDLITPVTPPPDSYAFNSTAKTTAKTTAVGPFGLSKHANSPKTTTSSSKMPTLKRKASSELRGPAVPPQPQKTLQFHQQPQQQQQQQMPQMPSTTSFSPQLPTHSLGRDPLSAFMAMGLLPNMSAMNNNAGLDFATWQQQQQQQQRQNPSSTTTSTTTNHSATSTAAAATAATAATSPSLSSSSISPGPSGRPTTATNQPPAATNSSTGLPIPMPLPLPMPTSPLLASLPPDLTSSKFSAAIARIAAYYQQRCQAIATFQHQKCQAWATMQRQKCQETMQAAMLVVAWYVRDRILRRRRKQKKRFQRAVKILNGQAQAQRAAGNLKERVAKWVAGVPKDVLPVNTVAMDQVRDQEEENFSLDAEAPLDRDGKLLEVADNLIRSQYHKVEVPLLGLLSFDESSDEEEEEEDHEQEEEEEEDDDEEEEFEDDEYEEDDLEEELELEIQEEKRVAKAKAAKMQQMQAQAS